MAGTMAGIGHYHLAVKSVGRASGGTRSASEAAAYRSGGVVLKRAAYRSAEVTVDRVSGEVYDYSRKQGVLESHILVPEHVAAPEWAHNRNRLWNAAERAEPRKNGRIATEIEVALPHNLSREQNRELVLGYVQELVNRHNIVADVAIHQGKDSRNIHSHVLFSHREITADGFGDLSNRHTVEKSGKAVQLAGIAAQPRDVEALRQGWEEHVNRAYARAGQDMRVDHRSYARQGRDLTPTRYLGPRHSDPERTQVRDALAAYNKRIMAQRQERESLRERTPAIDRAACIARAKVDRNADRVPSGWRDLTVSDVARELSQSYADKVKEITQLKADVAKASRVIDQRTGDKKAAEYAREERWRQMSAPRKALHKLGLHDPQLKKHEDETRRAGYVAEKWKVHRWAVAGTLERVEREAETELQKVRPRAEATLAARQRTAEAARAVLREASRERERERVPEREGQTMTRGRARSHEWER